MTCPFEADEMNCHYCIFCQTDLCNECKNNCIKDDEINKCYLKQTSITITNPNSNTLITIPKTLINNLKTLKANPATVITNQKTFITNWKAMLINNPKALITNLTAIISNRKH